MSKSASAPRQLPKVAWFVVLYLVGFTSLSLLAMLLKAILAVL